MLILAIMTTASLSSNFMVWVHVNISEEYAIFEKYVYILYLIILCNIQFS